MLQPYSLIFPGTDQWQRVRGVCMLTCSDYASAVNSADAYMSRILLYNVKKGLKDKNVSDYTQKIMENGTMQEKLCIEWFESCADPKILYFRPGFFIDPFDPRLGGSPDGVLYVHGTPLIVEIKSPVNWIEDPGDVKWRHLIQLMGVMHASGSIYEGLLVYFSSEKPSPSMFYVRFDPLVWSFIYDGLKDFLTCMERDIPPPTPCKKTFRGAGWNDISEWVVKVESLAALPKMIKDLHDKRDLMQ